MTLSFVVWWHPQGPGQAEGWNLTRFTMAKCKVLDITSWGCGMRWRCEKGELKHRLLGAGAGVGWRGLQRSPNAGWRPLEPVQPHAHCGAHTSTGMGQLYYWDQSRNSITHLWIPWSCSTLLMANPNLPSLRLCRERSREASSCVFGEGFLKQNTAKSGGEDKKSG